MARINMDKQAIIDVCSDDIVQALEDMMMLELEKPDNEINTDLVDECVKALLEIQQDKDKNFVALVPIINSGKFLQKITNDNTSK